MPGPGIALCPACGPCMPPYTWGGGMGHAPEMYVALVCPLMRLV